MQKLFIKSFILSAVTALAVIISPNAQAQLVSTGLTGSVRGSDGSPLVGAPVTAIHTPTNATFTSTTNTVGRFNFRGLPVGGPYTLTARADGYSEVVAEGITTELGNDVEVTLTLKSDVLQLEKFIVGGGRSELDGAATGSGIILSSDRLENKPTSERSLADMISASPLVTIRDTFGDREESQITAVGQNNRYNSVQIDGSRINDLFGLNATGLASFFNPLSLDTIEQLAVQISPYDVRQAGFTGASINAVTKSGTNHFHGSAYAYFRGDQMFGLQMQGYNPREEFLTGAKINPRLERSTYGATLGGPIIKNKLFFFVNYEKFESTIAGRDGRFATPSEGAILTQLAAIASAANKDIDWGAAVTGQTANTSEDEKISAKLDWNINSDHRLTLRYTTTEGAVPQFGNFAGTSLTINGISGGIIAAPDGHFYTQTRKEKTIAGQLNSQWTQNFKTEVRYSTTTQDQLTPVNSIAPQILIDNVTGTDLNTGATVTNGGYTAGTEQFRHGNIIGVDSQQLSITGDYFWKDLIFTGGYEREQTDFFNLFRNGSYGLVAYANMTNFLSDTNAVITRNVYDPNVRNPADISDMATNGFFGQAKWDVNPRLSILGGLRYELVESSTPPLNQAFVTATGFRNDGSVDGGGGLSPRIGFNYALDEERKTQIRGGIGHFFGRVPWVIFSNSWNAPGVGAGQLLSNQGQLPTSLTAYLRDHFDPANPIGTFTDNPSIRREVDFNDDGTEFPQSWRGNLALEHQVKFLDSVFTAEFVHSVVDKAIFVTNENLRPTSIGADGRQRFAGFTGTLANAKFPGYTNIIRVRNTDVGKSTYFTLQWSRPIRNKWGFDLAYTHGRATEAQSTGQTTAGGQWFRNAVFNQNSVEEGTADFEIKDRIQVSLTRQFEVVKNWRTTATLYYAGRSGNPYTWVFGGDLNGDGTSANDRAAVPSGLNDARFDFSLMTTTQRDNFLAYVASSEVAEFAGGIAPKNSGREHWVNQLDLKLIQEIPIRGNLKVQMFFDFINFGAFISTNTFGYYETIGSSNGVFRTRSLTNGSSYGPDGRIRPTFTSTPSAIGINNGMSRWRIQLGTKILF